jgi:hypothetical protein
MILFKGMTQVVNVEEKFETVRGYKDSNGQTVVVTRSCGWFIRITDSAAISFGPDKPDVKAGDRVLLTLEKPDA